ncbi:hypothetical protein NWP96_04215 [Mycoplasmopsis cynos]|nr:hypothetical protein [Mycoplasmopsis cynos]
MLNNKNANSNTELINNKSKIKELENQLGICFRNSKFTRRL